MKVVAVEWPGGWWWWFCSGTERTLEGMPEVGVHDAEQMTTVHGEG